MLSFILLLLSSSHAFDEKDRIIQLNGTIQRCPRLRCPRHCELSIVGGCPHNCNCGPPPVCPDIICPELPPTCTVHTLLDGCQRCACDIPVVPRTINRGRTIVYERVKAEEKFSDKQEEAKQTFSTFPPIGVPFRSFPSVTREFRILSQNDPEWTFINRERKTIARTRTTTRITYPSTIASTTPAPARTRLVPTNETKKLGAVNRNDFLSEHNRNEETLPNTELLSFPDTNLGSIEITEHILDSQPKKLDRKHGTNDGKFGRANSEINWLVFSAKETDKHKRISSKELVSLGNQRNPDQRGPNDIRLIPRTRNFGAKIEPVTPVWRRRIESPREVGRRQPPKDIGEKRPRIIDFAFADAHGQPVRRSTRSTPGTRSFTPNRLSTKISKTARVATAAHARSIDATTTTPTTTITTNKNMNVENTFLASENNAATPNDTHPTSTPTSTAAKTTHIKSSFEESTSTPKTTTPTVDTTLQTTKSIKRINLTSTTIFIPMFAPPTANNLLHEFRNHPEIITAPSVVTKQRSFGSEIVTDLFGDPVTIDKPTTTTTAATTKTTLEITTTISPSTINAPTTAATSSITINTAAFEKIPSRPKTTDKIAEIYRNGVDRNLVIEYPAEPIGSGFGSYKNNDSRLWNEAEKFSNSIRSVNDEAALILPLEANRHVDFSSEGEDEYLDVEYHHLPNPSLEPETYPYYSDDYPNLGSQVSFVDLDGIPLETSKNLDCSRAHQLQIDRYFRPLYREVSGYESARIVNDIPLPILYKYTKGELAELCDGYSQAVRAVGTKIIRRCYQRYEPFDVIFYAFNYACDFKTKDFFKQHIGCIKSVSYSRRIAHCHQIPSILPPHIDRLDLVCKLYQMYLDCVRAFLEEQCGRTALILQYDVMKFQVKQYNKNCDIRHN